MTLFNLSCFIYRESLVSIKESSDEASRYWREIVTLYPSFKDGYMALAEIEKDKGNTEASRILIEEAKKLSPNEDVTLGYLH